MNRNLLKNLVLWKNDPERKPLVLKGARQVGKTWLMKEFARREYLNCAYFNFDEDERLKSIFENNKSPARILELLSFVSGTRILPGKTLIALDEIQESPAALNALKYFNENANEYHVIVAGSLLGTLLAQPKSYPVGKVNLLHVAPLTFDEFLEACDGALFEYYSLIGRGGQIEEIFHERLMDVYRKYLIIGGMPACVDSWIRQRDGARVASVQRELIELYEHDFSKYNGRVNAARILMVFRSIASQLAKPNEKFMYGAVREGARARDFEEAIEWLVSSGLLNRLYNVSKAEHPLPAFDKLDCFKLFFFDTGLLKHMAGVDSAAILLNSDYQFKGPLTENFVLQQLCGKWSEPVRYFADKHGELDFVLQDGERIVPCEVKSGADKSAPSFKRFIAKHSPRCAVRFSSRPYRLDGAIVNLPHYLACRTDLVIDRLPVADYPCAYPTGAERCFT